MKKSGSRFLALTLAVALMLMLTACGGDDAVSSAPSAPDTTPSTTTTPTVPTTTAPTKPQGAFNYLTGEYDMMTANNRPVGVVVTDESSTLVQINLEKADFFFESETEAGIPRIMAVFSSVDRLPDEIGPVRSARPHFVKMAKAMDAIYCHIGGSVTGIDTIKALGVNDVTDAEQINPILKNSKNYSWNRKTFVKSKVLNVINRRGFATTSSKLNLYQFGEKVGDTPATTVDVQISNSYDMAFTYNATTGLYEKHRNSLNTPVHHTYTGGPIAVSNVIVMYDRRSVDPKDANRIDFALQSGSGILASGGKARTIQWKNTSAGLRYYEADGTTPLTVATGKTFVCLTSDTLKSRTNIK